MPVSTARRLCPQAVFLPVDFAYYGVASRQFHGLLRELSEAVEPAGSDEAYLDVEHLPGDVASQIAEPLRARIAAEIGITASIGAATSKVLAKVASDAAKPDGLLVIEAGGEAAFLAPLPVRDLPGVGPALAERLDRLGITTLGGIQSANPLVLRRHLGTHGAELQARASGIDRTPVHSGRGAARSISRERTFGEDQTDPAVLVRSLRRQCEQVSHSLKSERLSARTVTLKLRFAPFDTVTRSATSPQPVDSAVEIAAMGEALFATLWRQSAGRPVRLIGVGVGRLQERARQLRLGERPTAAQVHDTVRAMEKRFGRRAVMPATELYDDSASAESNQR
jgi:DNA polymerase-4